MKIIVRRRSDYWHASIDGSPGLWEAGKTQEEALGRLIRFHQKLLGIELEVHSLPTDQDFREAAAQGSEGGSLFLPGEHPLV